MGRKKLGIDFRKGRMKKFIEFIKSDFMESDNA